MSAPFVGARVAARPGTSGRDLTSPTRTQRNVGRTVRPARRALIVASTPFPEANEAVDVMEWDVVVFRDGDGLSVGKVESVRVDDGTCVCQPLFQEEDSGVWLEATYTRGAKTVRIGDVAAILDADFAQRMAPDRVSNPHGEHAEDFWEIPADLPDGVRRGE